MLDLSMGWAGPLVGQMFAEMGAEVIKVEDTHHFDWWRGSLSMAPPEISRSSAPRSSTPPIAASAASRSTSRARAESKFLNG